MAEVNATEILEKLPKNIRGVVTESARLNGDHGALSRHREAGRIANSMRRSRKRKPGLPDWVCEQATA